MQRYRSGRNELDSKTCGSGNWETAERLGITGFSEISTFIYGGLSTDFLHFFYAFLRGFLVKANPESVATQYAAVSKWS